jgi:hypothetical protein
MKKRDEGDHAMASTVVRLKTKIEVGSVVATAFKRSRAEVLGFVDEKTMTVRWEASGEVADVLRVAFILA